MARRKTNDIQKLLSGQPIDVLKAAANSYTTSSPIEEETAAQKHTEDDNDEQKVKDTNRKKTTRLYVRIREDRKAELAALADQEGLTLSAYITMVLEKKLKEERQKDVPIAPDPVTTAPSIPKSEKQIAPIKVYTMQEAASLLKVKPRTVSNYIKSGRLKASKSGGEWRITLKALKEFVGA